MKTAIRIVIFLALLVVLVWPSAVLARDLLEDRIVFGGIYRLESGETLNGDLVVLGGVATLEEESNVTGDIVLMGGTLEVNGEVDGNIVGIGGLVSLESEAVVHGDVNLLGAHLQRAEGAQVDGDVNPNLTGPFTFNFPGGVQAPSMFPAPRFDVQFSPVLDLLWFMFRLFLWAALGVLVALFLPQQVERTGKTVIKQPVISGGLGLLTAIVAPIVILVMAITLILVPVSLITVMVVAVAWGFGLVSLGLQVGKRLQDLLNQEWALAVSAGVGTFVLILVLNGIDALIPCIGWTVPAMAGVLGLGAVILTRFGTQDYPPLGPGEPTPVSELPSPPSPESPPQEPPVEAPGTSEVGKKKPVPPKPVEEETESPLETEAGSEGEETSSEEGTSEEDEIPPAI